jgi:signal transduction histidine kinase
MNEIQLEGRRLLEALSDGVILVQDRRIVYGNPAASDLLGAPLPDQADRLAPTVLAALVDRADEEQRRVKEEFSRGTPLRWIEASSQPLADPAGGVLLVLRDVTERRNVEAMRRDFVADASHELKTPVASIQAAAETLVRALDDHPEAARRFALQVQATAGRLSQMVTDLLDLSRVESERPKMDEVDLGLLVRKEADRIADRAEVQGVDLEVEGESPVVTASRKDLRLAVRNLLDNAIAYTEAGGTVTVSIFQNGNEGLVAVSDTGIGIPGRDVRRIFERFYRVDDARNRETGGTGLGLSIVRHVAEMHGGAVEVESELGRGSTFRLRLPLMPT